MAEPRSKSRDSEPQSWTINVVDSFRERTTSVKDIKSLRDLFEALKRFELVAKDVEYEDIGWQEDSDGTVVDNDEYFVELPSETVLMFCGRRETWQPQFKRHPSSVSGGDCPDGAGGEESFHEVDYSGERREQRQYAAIVGMLATGKVRDPGPCEAATEKSARDETDAASPPSPVDLEDAVHVLCEADPQSLAKHLHITQGEATDLQITAILALDKLQNKRDQTLLDELEKSHHLTSSAPPL